MQRNQRILLFSWSSEELDRSESLREFKLHPPINQEDPFPCPPHVPVEVTQSTSGRPFNYSVAPHPPERPLNGRQENNLRMPWGTTLDTQSQWIRNSIPKHPPRGVQGQFPISQDSFLVRVPQEEPWPSLLLQGKWRGSRQGWRRTSPPFFYPKDTQQVVVSPLHPHCP